MDPIFCHNLRQERVESIYILYVKFYWMLKNIYFCFDSLINSYLLSTFSVQCIVYDNKIEAETLKY